MATARTPNQADYELFGSLISNGTYKEAADLARGFGFSDAQIAQYVGDAGLKDVDGKTVLKTDQTASWLAANPKTTSQVGALTTTPVTALATSQVGALTTTPVTALATSQVGALTTTPVTALATTQVGALTTPPTNPWDQIPWERILGSQQQAAPAAAPAAAASPPPSFNLNQGNQRPATEWKVDPKTQTTAGQLQAILAGDNPLLVQARTRALQRQNANGTLNSSMATGAAESALYDAALQIATPDAQTYADAAKFNAGAGNEFNLQSNSQGFQGDMANFNLKANEFAADTAQDRTLNRDSVLNNYTLQRDKINNDFSLTKLEKEAAITALRDQTLNTYTTLRDETLDSYTTKRDKTLNDYTTGRDATLNTFTTQRDAILNDQTLTRDARNNAYTTLRDRALQTNTLERDRILNTQTSDRDALLQRNTLERDRINNEFDTTRINNSNTTAAQTAARGRINNARENFGSAMANIQSNPNMEPADKDAVVESLRVNYNAIIKGAMAELGITDQSWLLTAAPPPASNTSGTNNVIEAINPP